jgi:Tfp pilus assembly protein PilO
MKNIIAILLTVSATGLFYVYINPTWEDIKALRIEKAEYDEALANSHKVQEARDELLEKYNHPAPSDLKRLEKLLPDNVDNIRLIIEIDKVAARYNMILKNVKVSASAVSASTGGQGLQAEVSPYGTAELSFDVTGQYETYRTFIKDLQESLRIIDITRISFNVGKEEKDNFRGYEFQTALQTYWLK